MTSELTGIRSGDGAKMKAEVGEDTVMFRGAIKAEVPFEEIVAEARGTLLVLSFRGNVVELGAGAKASALAAKVRSPPSRVERLGIPSGVTTAVAGPLDASFRSELSARTHLVPGVPKEPVDLLFFAVEAVVQLAPLPKLLPLVVPGGALWVVYRKEGVGDKQVAAAAKGSGLKGGPAARFSATHAAMRLARS